MTLPSPLRQKRSRDAFNARAEDLTLGWLKRTREPEANAEQPHAWLKREAYSLILEYLDDGLIEVMKKNFRIDQRSTPVIEESLKNPFKLGLLAMFADESILSRKNRHVFGNQMLYAWTHDVPPEFLNGFLAVTGGAEAIARKLKSGFIEPGFENRFRRDRLVMPQ